jgi:hypothetical protein
VTYGKQNQSVGNEFGVLGRNGGDFPIDCLKKRVASEELDTQTLIRKSFPREKGARHT